MVCIFSIKIVVINFDGKQFPVFAMGRNKIPFMPLKEPEFIEKKIALRKKFPMCRDENKFGLGKNIAPPPLS